jgi:hypothetical protein
MDGAPELDYLVFVFLGSITGAERCEESRGARDMIRTAFKGTLLVLLACIGAGSARSDEHSVLPLPIYGPTHTIAATTVAAEGDTFPLAMIGSVEYSEAYTIAFGDTDHDGANELALTNLAYFYRIWEHQGDNVYTLVASGTSDSYTYAMGDLDQDGRGEIIGQTSGHLQVFESVDAFSHPSELVWSSPYLSNFTGHTTIGDTDRDGRMEIIHSVNSGAGSTSHLAIFENTGDNAFAQVFDGLVTGPSATGEKVIADLDGDGNLEIALCGIIGWLHVFESPSDNVWVLTAREWTGLSNAYDLEGGRDTDGNGKREMFVLGTLLTDSTALATTVVYESLSDNSYAKVASLSPDSGTQAGNTLCNLDGVGPDEYLMRSGPGVRIFRATGPGNWQLVGTAYGVGGGLYSFDLNQNGLPEVVWPYYTTRIFEYSGTPTDSNGATWHPAKLDIVPNPFGGRATLRFAPGAGAAARLAVFDIRGRIVERSTVEVSGASVLWQPRDLPAGVYLVRLEDGKGRVLARGRGTIVR